MNLKRVFAMVLSLVLVISFIPMIASAEVIMWRVTYDLNGAVGTVSDPTVYSASSNRPVILDITDGVGVVPPSGKEFAGWTPVKALADRGVPNEFYAPGKTITLRNNAISPRGVELFAVWKDIESGPFAVEFRTKIASLTVSGQTVAKGGKIAKPDDLSYAGYTFKGWYSDAYFRGEWDFDADVVTKDLTLHAKWEEDNDPANVPFTVTYHLSPDVTGEPPAAQYATPNATWPNEGGSASVRGLNEGTIGPEGKVFLGWCTTPKRILELMPGDQLWVKHEGTHLYDVWADANPDYSNAVTVNFDDVKQKMTGLGDSVAFHRSAAFLQMKNKFDDAGFTGDDNPARQVIELAYNPIKGAGFSVLRVIIGDGGIVDPVNKTKWGNQHWDGPSDSVWPEPGEENIVWVKEDWANNPELRDKFDEDQIWVMKEAIRANPNTKINAAAWSTPYWMKNNLGVRNDFPYDPFVSGATGYTGRHDVPYPIMQDELYADYAKYLVEYAWGMYAWFGIPIYSLSPTNEPEIDHPYSAQVLHGDDYERFLLDYLKPAFEKAVAEGKVTKGTPSGEGSGYGAVAPMPLISAPEGTRIDRSTSPVDIGTPDRGGYGAMMAKQEIQDFVDIFGTHVYEYTQFRYEPQVAEAGYFYPDYMNEYKDIWMNELSRQWATYGGGVNDMNMRNGLHWARLVNNLFASEPGFSSYQHWFGMTGGLFTLPTIGTYSNNGLIRIQKRFYCFAQFSKFMNDKYYRVGVSDRVPFSGGNVTAYKDGDDFSIVILNEDLTEAKTITLELNGNNAKSIVPYRTSDNENVRKLPAIAVGEDGKFTVTLPPLSITTFVNDKGADNVPGFDIRDGSYNYPLSPSDNDGRHGVVVNGTSITASNGSWIKYSNFNFSDGTLLLTSGATRALRINADVTPIKAGKIEIRIDGPNGKLVGLVDIPADGAEGSYYAMIDTGDTAAYKFHDLYLVFRGEAGDLFELNEIRFDNTYMAPANNLVTNGSFANVDNWEGLGATVSRIRNPIYRTGAGTLSVADRTTGSGVEQALTGLEKGGVYKLNSFLLPPVPNVVTSVNPHASTYAECGDAEASLVFYKDGSAVAEKVIASRAKINTLDWNQLSAVFVYEEPAEDFDTVKLRFATSTDDTFYLAEVSVLKVEYGDVVTSVVGSPKKYVAGCAANIRVLVEGNDLDNHKIEAFVAKNGVKLAKAAVNGGAGKIAVEINVLDAGEYDILVEVDGTPVSAADSISVVAEPAGLWTPVPLVLENGFTVTFGAPVSFNEAKKSVKISGVQVDNGLVTYDGAVLTVSKAVTAGQEVVISGVKYADLFPSYSFTFTVRI